MTQFRTPFLDRALAPLVALLALGLLVLQSSGVGIAQTSQIGVAASVRGSVSVDSAGVTRAPAGGDAMLLGDRVRTQVQSGMQVLLLDESVFTIGESNDLVIDRFVYDPDRGVGEIAARTTQGFLRFVSGGVGSIAPQNVAIETPSATIGTRGTTVDIVVGEAARLLAIQMGLIGPNDPVDVNNAVLVILRGPSTALNGITGRGQVEVSNAGGSVVVRREGFGVFVPAPGAAPLGPAQVPPNVNDQVIASIELPGSGILNSVPGTGLPTLPTIDVTPSDLLPGPDGNNPDVTGPEFDEPCLTPTSFKAKGPMLKGGISDPCARYYIIEEL